MNPEIENLINMALADGAVTEKEKNVILKKAEVLGLDRDEVEMVLDGKLALLAQAKASSNSQTAEIKVSREGNIRKCPACGATSKAFQVKCEDCGHEFRGTTALSSKQKLFEELSKIESEERNRKVDSWVEKLNGQLGVERRILQRKASCISSFPLPNSKEDILEFFNWAIHESQSFGAMHDDGTLRRAWKTKANELASKIRLELSDDEHAKLLLTEYASASKVLRFSPRFKYLFFILLGLLLLGSIIGFMVSKEGDEEDKEFARLATIEREISVKVADKKYDEALILIDQLTWTWELQYPRSQETAASFDKKRESLRATILKFKEDADAQLNSKP